MEDVKVTELRMDSRVADTSLRGEAMSTKCAVSFDGILW